MTEFTDEIMNEPIETADTEEVDTSIVASFEINASVLAGMLTSCRQYGTQLTGVTLIEARNAVSTDVESEIYSPYAVVDSDTSCLIVGAAGTGLNGNFVQVACPTVNTEGIFLINETDKLKNWASVCGTNMASVSMKRDAEDDSLYLELGFSGNVNRLPIVLFYTEDDLENHFAPKSNDVVGEEFSVSTTDESNFADVAKLFNHAEKFNSGALGRAGDLMFTAESSSDYSFAPEQPVVEFVTSNTAEGSTVATVHRSTMPGLPVDLDWNISVEHLKAVSKAVRAGAEARFIYDDGVRDDDEDTTVPRLKTVTSEVLGKGDTAVTSYVSRVMQPATDQSPLKTWIESEVGDSLIFNRDNCKLFGTFNTDDFIDTTKRIWALSPSAIIRVTNSEDEDTGDRNIKLYSGSQSMPDVNTVIATAGESSISSMLFHGSIQSSLASLLEGYSHFQIRSFPNTEEENGESVESELANAMLIVPVENGKPSENNNDPSRYMLVAWS